MDRVITRPNHRSPPSFGPTARKTVLAVHVIASVSWIGASLCLVTLALTGRFASDAKVSTGAYVATNVITSNVTVPVSLATLVTGLLIAMGTKWGLFRHWWVLVSLLATALMTGLVFFALDPLTSEIARRALAADGSVPTADAVGNLGVSAIVAPCVATVALSAIAALNVFKPRGRVRSGPVRNAVGDPTPWRNRWSRAG